MSKKHKISYPKETTVLERYTYEDKGTIERVVKNLDKLTSYALKGDQNSMCIRADIVSALNYHQYNTPYRRLTIRQFEALYYHMILGLSQWETAEIMKITQPAVSKYVKNAVAKLFVILIEPALEEQERAWEKLNEAHQKKVEGHRTYFSL